MKTFKDIRTWKDYRALGDEQKLTWLTWAIGQGRKGKKLPISDSMYRALIDDIKKLASFQ